MSTGNAYSPLVNKDEYNTLLNAAYSSNTSNCCCRPQRLWHRMILCRFSRKLPFRNIMFLIIPLVIFFIYYYVSFSSSYTFTNLLIKTPKSMFKCTNNAPHQPHQHGPSENSTYLLGKLREIPKVLLFTETQYSQLGRHIAEILVACRFKYKMEVIGKSLPLLTNLSTGKYGVVIFENFERYLLMDQWNRELLDKYLLAYGVGLIGFMPPHKETRIGAKLYKFPLFVSTNFSLKNVSLEEKNPVLRITRAGETLKGSLPNYSWTLFNPDHPTYIPLEYAFPEGPQYNNDKQILAILDNGKFDGIKRVLFGGGLHLWLHRLLLLDAISYLSMGRLSLPLEHYILVDIDDIFVGPSGTRMTPMDVEALVKSQKLLQTMVPGWKFNLGFCGGFYKKGSLIENAGDEALLKYINEFSWFGHMWGHTQPHKIEVTEDLVKLMEKNKEFALEHSIPTDSGYSVAPHHSGVYPVHEPLFEAWKKIWNIRVTSSEEYPHLKPARLRRGFIHRNIMVLPRLTCGLYTHTIYLDKYPGGKKVLLESIFGGELFQTIVFNTISIFMTHQSNYANDRLALYTFESVIKYIQCWTNLKLQTIPPVELGEKYFQMYPAEVDPIWGYPCLDHRHIDIWSQNKSCEQLPKFLVIGPQKTGTTALYSFLKMHPAITANFPSSGTYEEIQFFNGRNYFKGIDWYMNHFPLPKNSSVKYLFEKSATYFDGEVVPRRVKALLPSAQLVCIIIPPEKRAYSWYHHMRAHDDVTALSYSFNDVITATSNSPKPLRELRNRCLNPGMYARHILRWMDYFPAQNFYIIDGEKLKKEPVTIMNDLQKFLEIQPIFNYTEHLRFDSKKGFYCQVTESNKTKCLGKSKGRQYAPMQVAEETFLRSFYKEHNIALEKLLVKLNYPLPTWLYEDLLGY